MSSSDFWATKANQTPVNAIYRQRVNYNARLTGGWQSMGLAGVFDCAHAIDPGDLGVWGADELSRGYGGGGFATVLNGSVASVRLGASGANGRRRSRLSARFVRRFRALS